MSKKDYELIASAFRLMIKDYVVADYKDDDYMEVAKNHYRFALERLAHILGYKLLTDNPKFNQAKFEEACGL